MSQSNTAFFLKGDHRVRMISYICISVHDTFDSLQQMDLQRADTIFVIEVHQASLMNFNHKYCIIERHRIIIINKSR